MVVRATDEAVAANPAFKRCEFAAAERKVIVRRVLRTSWMCARHMYLRVYVCEWGVYLMVRDVDRCMNELAYVFMAV